MYLNRYTQAVSKIKAPEGAVEKMLKTAESFEKKEKVIHMKKWIKSAVAASVAVAVTAGAIIGFKIPTCIRCVKTKCLSQIALCI